MTGLQVSGLTRSFGSVPVLHGVDLDVTGGLTAVLGASGCGKTTLLRLVAGFLEPDAGTIRIGDQVVAGAGRPVPPRARRTGYVPQEGALFPHLDVRANVAFGLTSGRRSARATRRVEEMLDLVELPRSTAGRQPHELSGGQQQRVALARALAPAPDLVLLDEPFSSLDAGLREETGRAVARALRASGTTALLVTHDQGEALSLADQVAVMRAGRIVQAAAPRDVYRAPVDAEVARFVGGGVVLRADARDGHVATPLGRLEVAGGAGAGPVEVLVRPEQIRLDAAGAVVRAVVDEVSYYGHHAAVRLSVLPDGPQVVARVVGQDAPDAGATVTVSVDGSVVALP